MLRRKEQREDATRRPGRKRLKRKVMKDVQRAWCRHLEDCTGTVTDMHRTAKGWHVPQTLHLEEQLANVVTAIAPGTSKPTGSPCVTRIDSSTLANLGWQVSLEQTAWVLGHHFKSRCLPS